MIRRKKKHDRRVIDGIRRQSVQLAQVLGRTFLSRGRRASDVPRESFEVIMPLFDFTCLKCGFLWLDRLQGYADLAPICPNCPHDGGTTMQRLAAAPSFIIKGFSEKNGYNGGQTYEVKMKEKDMRVYVKS